MATNENLKRLQSVITNLGVDLGEALVMIYRVFGWQWADPSGATDLQAKGVPDDRVDMVIDFFRCNYKTRFKILDPSWHIKLLRNIPEYRKDYEYECKQNQGKPWELRVPVYTQKKHTH